MTKPEIARSGRRGKNALFQEVVEDWLTLVTPAISYTTLAEYQRSLNRYFLPTYGRTPISRIGYEEFSLFVAQLPIRTGKTFNNVMTPVRGVFGYAQRTGKIKHDITENILWRKHQAPGPDPLERDEVLLVLAHLHAAYHPMWHNYFEIAIFAGLRPSEQIALRWPAVDARREQIRIDAARVRARDKGTKTNKVRYVDLQTPAIKALERQRALTWTQNGFVFINPRTGQRFADSSRPLEVWHKALRGVNIRERGAKQTRHTYATLCLHAGMNPAYVSRQMGHANAKMFFEVYSRWIDGDANTREKAKMDAYLKAIPSVTRHLALQCAEVAY